MTKFLMFEVDDIYIESGEPAQLIFKKGFSRAVIFLKEDQLKKLTFLSESELQNKELVEEAVDGNL